MQFISWLDYVLLPIYIGIVYLIAYNFRNRKYPVGHPWRPYFIPGLTVKIGGAIFIGLIYQYYYGGGDTANYFRHAQTVNSAFGESPLKWINLVFHIPSWYDGDYTAYTSQMEWYPTINNYAVAAVAAFLGIFTFNTFLPTSVLFAGLAFTGIWAMFRTFALQYPALTRRVALAMLFVPSTFIWGSGIFKDTICMFGLGWLLYATFQLLVQRNVRIGSIALGVLGFYLIAIIKIYILMAFLPALAMWILFNYSSKVNAGAIRAVLTLSIVVLTVGFLYLFSGSITQNLGQYSAENLLKTSTITREYILSSTSDQGSSYDLGAFDATPAGMLKKFPQAVNVSLYRPYLWEARKPIVLLNAIEAALFLWLTLKILFTIGPVKAWRYINSDPNIQFCLIFTIIFAFAVGISSYNFGSLSRYRIPCLPMFALALILIYYKHFPTSRPLLSIR